MALVALSLPILPGKKEQWQAMIKKMNEEPLKSALTKTRADAGVHERTFLQETPAGDMVIITLEGDNPVEAFGKMMQDPSMAEFAQFGVEVHGMDPTAPPPPMPTLVYDSKG